MDAARSPRRAALARFLALKGSIAVDGVSLTVNRVDDRAPRLRVQHQPDPAHGASTPALRGLAVGRRVNLEIDLIARYVERMLGGASPRRDARADHPTHLQFQPCAIAPIPELVAELAAGRMVILVDEEDRENEGDLVLAADHVTPEAINFMAQLRPRPDLPDADARALRAAAAAADGGDATAPSTAPPSRSRSRPPSGVTTGISAADRARTVQAAVRDATRAQRPGAARPHLPAAGAGRRRADARRPHRSRLRPRAAMAGLDAGRRDLRGHERRRHDGAPARPASPSRAEHGLKIGTIAEPDRAPQPQRDR